MISVSVEDWVSALDKESSLGGDYLAEYKQRLEEGCFVCLRKEFFENLDISSGDVVVGDVISEILICGKQLFHLFPEDELRMSITVYYTYWDEATQSIGTSGKYITDLTIYTFVEHGSSSRHSARKDVLDKLKRIQEENREMERQEVESFLYSMLKYGISVHIYNTASGLMEPVDIFPRCRSTAKSALK